jgi:hypothetical protein
MVSAQTHGLPPTPARQPRAAKLNLGRRICGGLAGSTLAAAARVKSNLRAMNLCSIIIPCQA